MGYAVRGVFSWPTNRDGAKENAERFYPNSEGIDGAEHELFFVSKRFKTMYVLHLDDLTYTNATTRSGLFDGQADQIQRILGDDSNDLLYFTEDGGRERVFTAETKPVNYLRFWRAPCITMNQLALHFCRMICTFTLPYRNRADSTILHAPICCLFKPNR
jgi:hypothetical protein